MSNELTPEGLRQRVKDYLEHCDTTESPTPHEDWAFIYRQAADAWEADKQRIAELEKQAEERIHIGYSNMYQIRYVMRDGEESGSFFPDADNQSDIPIYMLKRHINRLGHDFDISTATKVEALNDGH